MFTNDEEMFVSNEKLIKDQINKLIFEQQYQSAETLISLFISSLCTLSCVSSIQKQSVHAEYLEMLADIIHQQNNPRRAIEYYRQAWTVLKQLSSTKTPNKTIKIASLAMNANEASVKFKESKCLMELNDNNAALQELEIIPLKYRDTKTHLLLGHLYKLSNMKKQSILSYKEVLKLQPLSLESIESLALLGETYQDIITIVHESIQRLGLEAIVNPTQIKSSSQPTGWIYDYIRAQTYKRNGEFEKVNSKIQPLLTHFPDNLKLMSIQGLAAINADKYDQAYMIYKRIRPIDTYVVDNMDSFALMLHQKNDSHELSKLANDILSAAINRPIGWLIVALFCDLKTQHEKAMTFIDKAISLDFKYPLSYVLKGKLLLAQNQPKQAALAYFQANILHKDFMTLSGLIEANLGMGRFNEALATAKEALELLPNSSNAFYVMGKVLTKSPKTHNESVKAFAKALKLNPKNSDAALQLAQLFESMNKGSSAIDCLKDVISKGISSSTIQILLAKLLATQGRYADAITELHSVAATYPSEAEEAALELEKIEGMIRGDNASMQDDIIDERNIDIEESSSNNSSGVQDEFEIHGSSMRGNSNLRRQSFIHSVGISGGIRAMDMETSIYSEGGLEIGFDRELFTD